MEEVFYEVRPFIYFILSFYALVVSRNSSLMVFSGIFLLVSAAWVWKMRRDYRIYYQQQQQLNKQN